jgi:hypothetical protein
MNKYGPNVNKLILKLVSYESVPAGGGIESGLKFFTDKAYRDECLVKAEIKAWAAIEIFRLLPDNILIKDNNEEVAAKLLDEIKKKELADRARK